MLCRMKFGKMTVKIKSDIEIGKRFVREAYRLFPNASDAQIARRIGCSKTMLTNWKAGTTPNAIYLARLIHYGADVKWILLGGDNAV